MKSDTDTPEQKLARSNNGGEGVKRSYTLDERWDEVQAKNRAAGPWGIIRAPWGIVRDPIQKVPA